MGNIMGRFLELLREFDVVDLSPTLENDIPRWPTHPPLVIQPTGTHSHDGYYCQTIQSGAGALSVLCLPCPEAPLNFSIRITPPRERACSRVCYRLHAFSRPISPHPQNALLAFSTDCGTMNINSFFSAEIWTSWGPWIAFPPCLAWRPSGKTA